jgi:hypothetical protein
LFTLALWLTGDSDYEDKLLPIDPTPAGLVANQSYSLTEYLLKLLPLAEHSLMRTTPPEENLSQNARDGGPGSSGPTPA